MSAVPVHDLERTVRLRPLPTEQLRRPRRVAVPSWAVRVERGITVTARLGMSPTPTICLAMFGAVLSAIFPH